jgi:hypothetical protein
MRLQLVQIELTVVQSRLLAVQVTCHLVQVRLTRSQTR